MALLENNGGDVSQLSSPCNDVRVQDWLSIMMATEPSQHSYFTYS